MSSVSTFVSLFLVVFLLAVLVFSNLDSYVSSQRNGFRNKIQENILFNEERSSTMMHAWTTPIYRDNIEIWLQEIHEKNSSVFHRNLSNTIEEAFRFFLESLDSDVKFVESGAHALGTNQLFYNWQLEGGWDIIRKSESIQLIEDYCRKISKEWLTQIGQSHLVNKVDKTKLDIWATMHYGGISHLVHTHPHSLLSGVYYVNIPTDNFGLLILEDPRGPYPPFDNRIKIQPHNGDIVIFPSWLPHQVSSTSSQQPRISIAFNIPGEWESTSNLILEHTE